MGQARSDGVREAAVCGLGSAVGNKDVGEGEQELTRIVDG